ncbi:hypothetical protein GQ457_07G015140 [Hibiscus cannabinus]
MVCFAISVRNLSTDQFALVQFKDHILDPENVLANSWKASTSVCKWVGVSCGVIHQRVAALNLTNLNLTGNIPPHLGNLSFLVSLDFSRNHFFGHLPEELGHLHRLRIVKLSFNDLNGEIPPWFGNLHRVKMLEMGSNNFTGTIPQTLVNMSNLEILNLGSNQLFGQVPSSIPNISSLKEIDFGDNSLSGSLVHDFCVQLPNLESLRLYGNVFSGCIPSSIGKCSNLQILDLKANEFSGVIPRSIGNLTQLKGLYLDDNNLEGEIPEEIGNLLNIEELVIQNMKSLGGQIPSSIFNISSLKAIALANNSLSGNLPDNLCHSLLKIEGLFLAHNELSGNIPISIGNSTMLEEIGLYDNNLEGNLPPMTNVPKLEKLLVWGNKLSGNIPSSISNASMLKRIELQKNFFFGPIPDTFGNLRHLERFQVNNNNLTTGSAVQEWSFLSSLANCRNLSLIAVAGNPLKGLLPTYIGNLSTSLQYFYSYNCELKGNIPTEIGNLSNMLLLSLENNKLSGSIPASIGRLRNLQALDLSSNKLGGPISESICGLERLATLYLASNELHGPVLACLGDMTSLRYLSLGSNRLSSAIPSTLWNLKDILGLDLSSNYLNNSLALDVGNLRSLVNLNLSSNLLTGDISSTIGGLLTLLSLDLSDNELQGHIPESFGGLISLEFLDLSNNNLSGLIPKSLEKLSYLNHFNVSFNRLEGEIPANGCFPNFSSTSFMNNSALCGPPRLLVPPCRNNIHTNSKMILHALRYGLPAIGIVILLIVFTIMYRKCQSRSTTLPIKDDLLSVKTWRRISHVELSQATDGFEESNLLGSGSFGCVYRGRLSDGMEVAIKVFNLQTEGAFRSFDIECEAMSNIVHRNIVKLITCCSNIDFKALVLDFMSNGSLDKWLHSEKCSLDFLQRLNIMIDVATALEHLHTGHPTPVIHCDLKPSNILLDDNMVAHVGDFGIAKLLGEGDVMKQTMTLATIGYMAPEFGSTGIVSIKCDVYSYGIVLMETFTKKKPTDELFTEEMTMRDWVERSLCKGMVDADLLRREDDYFVVKANCISSIMELALSCSTKTPEERKDMKDVVVELKKIKQRFLNMFDKYGK